MSLRAFRTASVLPLTTTVKLWSFAKLISMLTPEQIYSQTCLISMLTRNSPVERCQNVRVKIVANMLRLIGFNWKLTHPWHKQHVYKQLHPFTHFCHAPLGVHSATCRHQSPEWTILSHVNCLIQGEVIRFQVFLLDSLHPRSTRASWWSVSFSSDITCIHQSN